MATAAAVANADSATRRASTMRSIPITPDKVAAGSSGRSGRHGVKAFAYVNAANEKDAVAALQAADGGRTLPIGRRHGPARRG